jgi:hypothetical protein
MTGMIASVLASLPAWALSALLEGHVSVGVDMVLGFVVWSICFIPTFMWLKRMREG